MTQTFLPENAPFTEAQRAWLNGFIAGLLGMSAPSLLLKKKEVPVGAPLGQRGFSVARPTLALDERMKLAAGGRSSASSWRRWGSSTAASAATSARATRKRSAREQRSTSASACPAGAIPPRS
jgi:hypothetical protein